MSQFNLMDLCRLCLDKDRVSIPIFEGEGVVKKLFMKIGACLPVKVSESDRLPKKICDDCIYKVELVYSFWNTTANAEKQLLALLGEADSEPQVPLLDDSVKTENEVGMRARMEESNISSNKSLPAHVVSKIALSNSTVIGGNVSGALSASLEMTNSTGSRLGNELSNQSREDESDEEDSDDDDDATYSEEEDDPAAIGDEESSFNPVEPTFVNVDHMGDEAGPSGLQHEMEVENMEGGEMPVEPSAAQPDELLARVEVKLEEDSDASVELLPIQRAAKASATPGKKPDPLGKEPANSSGDPLHTNKPPTESQNTPTKGAVKLGYRIVATSQCNFEPAPLPGPPSGSSPKASESNEPDPVTASKTLDNLRSTLRKLMYKEAVIEDVFDIDMNEAGESLYTCKTCKLKFTDLGMVRKHITEHTETRPFACEHCPRKYKSAAQLKSHVRIHGTGTYRFECEICGYCCTNRSNLDQHKRRHTEDFLVQCEECGKGYRSTIGLEAHMNRVHRSTTPYKCDECEQSFVSKSYLYFHMRHVHPRNEDCVCDICGKHFTSIGHWRRHRECHEKQTSYLCDLCGKSISSQSSLVEHRRIHTGEKPFMCPHCGKTFGKTSSLRFHVRVHTGEKPYKCEVCGKGFTQPSPMKIHMRTHTGERPYVCDICHEGFVSRTALNSHLEVHRRTGKARPVRRKSKVNKIETKTKEDTDVSMEDETDTGDNTRESFAKKESGDATSCSNDE